MDENRPSFGWTEGRGDPVEGLLSIKERGFALLYGEPGIGQATVRQPF